MPTPTNRTPLRVARGTYSNLNGSLSDLQEGEITFATDEGRLYVKQGGSLTSISASSQAAPGPANVTASPAFAGGNGTQGNPYQITSLGAAFSGAEAQSAQEITITGTPGDFVIFTDNSVNASGNRFANQVVGNVDSGGSFVFKLKYKDAPGTTVDNTTYNGRIQIGSVYFSWVVVQSNLSLLSEASATSIAISSLGVGGTATATEGTVTGGTSSYTYATRWQRSFNGTNGWFDTGNTGTTYSLQSADSGYYIRAVTTGTDSTPSNEGGPLTLDIASGSSSQINTAGAANVGSFVLTEDNTTGARFTSKTFSAVANLNPDGVPVSTKALKVRLDGSFSTFPDTSNVTAITPVDDIGTNLNANYLEYTNNAGGNSSSSYRNWSHHFVSSSAGSAFIVFATQYSTYNNMEMFRSTYGLDSGSNFSNSNSTNDSYSPRVSTGNWYPYGTTTQRSFYMNSGGGASGNGIRSSYVYKDDTILQYHLQGKWMYLADTMSTSSNSIWKSINTDSNYNAQQADNAGNTMGLTDDRQYAVNCSSQGQTPNGITFHIMNGDICDDNATVTVTDLTFSYYDLVSGASGGSNELQGFFGHGSKITFATRLYVSSTYYAYLYTCDFSVNDGSQLSHWVKTLGPVTTNEDFYPSQIGISGNKIALRFGTSSSSHCYISTNNGSSYSQFGVAASGWTISRLYGFAYSRGRLLAWVKGQNSTLTGQNYQHHVYLMSNDNGNSWTPSVYHTQRIGGYNTYGYVFESVYNTKGIKYFIAEGGYIAAIGSQNYSGTTSYYYRSLLYCDDSDNVTFTDTTNLNNNAFRSGNKVRQGSNTAIIARISGSSAALLSIDGTISAGSPLTNTINYFGGSLSTMYGVINSAGTVTDLTSTEPSFVNLGYLTDNTITFPATLPSGNSPDVELASGTTITVSAEFANSQGTVGATSNTVTPT